YGASSTMAVMVPSSAGSLARSQDQAAVQSSTVQANSAAISSVSTPAGSSEALGRQAAATRPSPTAPIASRSPSSDARSVPQPKQPGIGWSVSPGNRSPAATASS